MRFGIALPNAAALAEKGRLGRISRAADEMGYASVWAADHVLIPKQVAPNFPYNDTGAFGSRWDRAFYPVREQLN